MIGGPLWTLAFTGSRTLRNHGLVGTLDPVEEHLGILNHLEPVEPEPHESGPAVPQPSRPQSLECLAR